MAEKRGKTNVVISSLLFLFLALGALILLLLAVVLFLAQAIHSLPCALLIVGAVMGIASFAVYRVSMHPTLSALRSEYESILSLAKILQSIYSWGLERITRLFSSL